MRWLNSPCKIRLKDQPEQITKYKKIYILQPVLGPVYTVREVVSVRVYFVFTN